VKPIDAVLTSSTLREMLMRSHVAIALTVVFAGAACESPTATEVDVVSARFDIVTGENVPFLGSFSGQASFDSPTAPTKAFFEGSGIATQLGATVNAGVLEPLVFVPVPECELGVGIPHTHLETLTGANGDQLLLEMIDLACPIDETFLVFRGTGNWTVIGGSGRFAEVSGSGTAVGGGNFIDGVFEFRLTGSLTF
jgi:hypothetical protein